MYFKINLSVKERLALIDLLPIKGSRIDMKIAKNISEIIDFDEDEIKKIELKTHVLKNGDVAQITNPGKSKYSNDYNFTDIQIDLLKKEFDRLDKKKITPFQYIEIIDKICNINTEKKDEKKPEEKEPEKKDE